MMTDNVSAPERSARMARVKSKNTKPEMKVRKLLHSMGYRYRIHRADLPGTPDIVFPKKKVAIFVHGCFWHRHDDPNCKLARLPKSREGFWTSKLEGNRERDLLNLQRLHSLDWTTLTVWECELNDMETVSRRLEEVLK
jgi:DNA mismatch endonuclease, patch repair protein